MRRSDSPEARRPVPYLRRRLVLAWLALLWEQAWPALWPAAGVAGLFVAVALLDLLPWLPGWLHAAVLVGFTLAEGAALWRAWRRMTLLPDLAAARRRLEEASGLRHRPLTALEDRLATGTGDAATRALWRAHRRRMLAAARRVRSGWPHPGMAGRDPWALRAALGLLLIVAVVAAWGEETRRLARAVEPDIAGFGAGAPPTLDVWIAPPAHTGLAPVLLQRDDARPAGGAAAESIMVPAGSTVLAQVQGGRGVPQLALDRRRIDFRPAGKDAYKAEATIEEGRRLAVRQGGDELASWPISVVADATPRVEFLRAPTRTERATLRLDYHAEDDYGLAEVRAVIRRTEDASRQAAVIGGESIGLDLPLPGVRLKTARNTSYHDLTAHPWAGLPVAIRLVASDAVGHTGKSDRLVTVLPERIFQHPVARAIAELRKRLTVDPEARVPVARELATLAFRPSHYFDDIVVFLGLRMAASRLIHDRGEDAVASVQKLLWDTALRIEDGEAALAERDLRQAQKALMEALANQAPEEEIERLVDELRTALDRYLDALARQLEERLARGEKAKAPEPSDTLIESDDLRRMVERLRELTRTGAREAAQQLLSQLQSIIENLRAGMFDMQARQGEGAFEMMRDVQNMMLRQRQLLDRTFRRTQGGEAGRRMTPGGDTARQEGLRRDLGELMRRLGESMGDIPSPLGRAERAMREAVEALRRDAPASAVGPQGEALDQLQQGARAMAQRFMERAGEQASEAPGPGATTYGQRRDPLGRPLPGMGAVDPGDVRIPDEMELRRAREILDELRRRAADRDRPPVEQDYIERLLPRF